VISDDHAGVAAYFGDPIQFTCNTLAAGQAVRFGWGLCKLGIISLRETFEKSVSIFHGRSAGKAKLFDQTVLKRPIGTFDTTFGLRAVGAQNLDVKLSERTTILRHTRHMLIGLRIASAPTVR
jgi:hypothetical protein